MAHWTDSQRADLARHYSRIGHQQGEVWPPPPDNLEPAEVIELLKKVPNGAGREGYIAAFKPPEKAVPVSFVANNELALHVRDPAAAEKFYTEVLGCVVFDRKPACISLTNGALKLYLLYDPAPTHDVVVPSFTVTNRSAALAQLKAAGCMLVPIGPHAPGEFYVKDPHGVVFDVVERGK
ncbi:MAG TPA: VOC family protein [Gemmatimonadaceae bacterium]|nr:VOC family protein [Gemmatimonadaceae bacterium]